MFRKKLKHSSFLKVSLPLFLLSLFFLFLLSACPAAGKTFLEQNYPRSPGLPGAAPGSQTTISPNSSLGDVIRYIISWVIIVGAIIAFISLIAGGVIYLTSTGEPNKMAEGKKIILNAFLGLLIILGSYLVLVTINPQLIVMEIKKVPVSQGILLSDADEFSGPQTFEELELKISQGHIQYLNQSIYDCEKKFGRLSNNKFSSFDIKSIGFFESSKDNISVVFLSQKGFKGKALDMYSYRGRIRLSDKTIQSNGTSYIDGALKFINIKSIAGKKPLSIMIKNTGPGVYLYAKNKWEYVLLKEGDYPKLKDLKFNDKAYSIEIKNGANDDFLAVLFESDKYYGGPLRLFLEKNKGGRDRNTGNTLPNKLTSIIDRSTDKPIIDPKYGFVYKASSARIFNLAPIDPPEENPCREVRLCTEVNYTGDCLVYYTNPPEKIDLSQEEEEVGFSSPKNMPFFKPVVLTEEKVSYRQKNSTTTKERTVDFNDNIKSIQINGSCLVVLFENSDLANKAGRHSQIFTESNADLTKENIYQCGGIKLLGWHHLTHSCASAVSVFPISENK